MGTGEILALASYPTYSLATYSSDAAALNQDTRAPMFNRAIQGTYAPGSTFKMVTAAAALENGIISPTTRIQTRGVYTYYAPSYTPKCWIYNQYGGTHGSINVSQALLHSCNYFFYDVGRQVGIDTLVEYAHHFGLGLPTWAATPSRSPSARGTASSPPSSWPTMWPPWWAAGTATPPIC